MQVFLRNDPRERYLADTGLSKLVSEICSLLDKYGPDRVVVNLSENDLTFSSVRELVDLLSKREPATRLLAVDLSLNRMQASWKEMSVVTAALLEQQLVQYLNLSLNYLPALETLSQDSEIERKLGSYGCRLSLGFDHEGSIGEPAIDDWTQNARNFKRIAYNEDLPL